MYFWNVDPLLADLQEDRLPKSEKAKYCLLYILAAIAAYGLCMYFLQMWKQSIDSCDLLLIAINVTGVWICYAVNSRGDNRAFFTRFISLSIPVLSKTLIYSIAFSAIVFKVLRFSDLDHFVNLSRHGGSAALFLFVITIMIFAVYYVWLASLFSLFSNRERKRFTS